MICSECPLFVSNKSRDIYSCLLYDDSDDDEIYGIKYGGCRIQPEIAEWEIEERILNGTVVEKYLLPNYNPKEGNEE